jgi:hypothetical protein
MVAINLTDREQAAFRALISTQPVLGLPLPATDVLEKIAQLIPCDGVVALLADNRGYTVDGTELPTRLDGWRVDRVPSERPFYIGTMHWSRTHSPRRPAGFPSASVTRWRSAFATVLTTLRNSV